MKHHPDKGGDENRFKEIANAYGVLGDEGKRKQYDQQKNNPFAGFNGGGGGNADGGLTRCGGGGGGLTEGGRIGPFPGLMLLLLPLAAIEGRGTDGSGPLGAIALRGSVANRLGGGGGGGDETSREL